MRIGFIGAGNMARAIIGGVLDASVALAGDVRASAPSQRTRDDVLREFSVLTYEDNAEVAAWADVVVLAVKPQFLANVIAGLGNTCEEKLVISIAAGKTLSWLEEQFAYPVRLVRAMPNTPALVHAGVTGICGNTLATDVDITRSLDIFDAVGETFQLTEPMIDVIGALAGSGPAFTALFIEALADGAVAEGMPRVQALEIAAATVAGSARLAAETGKHPGQLKDMVTSPGGTTIEGVQVLEDRAFRGAAMAAVRAAVAKTRQL